MYVTYCHTSIKIWNFTPETQLSLAFYYRVSIECSIMVLKSQQMVLHANLQSEMVLTIFTILGGSHVQQLIFLKVIIIKQYVCSFEQSVNYLFYTWYVKRIY